MSLTIFKSENSGRGTARSLQATYQAGFSLIELLVSMALFIVVITMGIGALLVLISANVKAQNNQEAVSNIQFALDSMAREVRTGAYYYCDTNVNTNITAAFSTRNCAGKGYYLSIVEGGKSLTDGATNRRIAYRYNSTDKSIERRIGNGGWTRLTSSNVIIEEMHFNVINTSTKDGTPTDSLQPNVTIYIKGKVEGVAETSSEFRLQTTVTKRVLDL